MSCTAPANCVVFGSYSINGQCIGVPEHWNGTTWTVLATPNPTGTTEAELTGVSCPASATTCMAAGFYATPTINISTLAEVSSRS